MGEMRLAGEDRTGLLRPIAHRDDIVPVLVLQAVDVTGVEPTRGMERDASAEGEHARADEVTPGLARDVVLEQAPDATKEFFRVPRVIGRGEES